MELISVIVPIYNAELYLDRCIQSIVNQTYTNIELILVDDGSMDGSLFICDSWAKKDTRIKVLHLNLNAGVSRARNVALEAAAGELVFFCDADDEITDICLEGLVRALKKYDSDISVGQIGFVYDGDKLPDIPDSIEQVRPVSISVSDLFDMQREKRFVTGKLFRAEAVNGTRFDTSIPIGEDTVFLYSVLQNRHLKLSFCPEILYLLYRDHISATTGRKVLLAYYNVGKWCFENWKSGEPEEKDCILLAGFKNLFLYRYRAKKNDGYPSKKEVSRRLKSAVPDLVRERSISFKQRAAYAAMTYIPALYSAYASRKH